MKIMITGATGLIGKALVAHFSNHELTLVGRTREKIRSHFSDRHSIVTWDELKTFGETHVQHQDVIINLAGENIGAKRWSTAQKQKIVDSRVDATRTIAALCASINHPPRILNASAVGVYGFSNDEIFTEKSALKNPACFLETVAESWE